jgi:AcrR family transcriptional regulator
MSKSASLRDRLLAQALILLERGETDLSLRALARETGVSAMAPYRHFVDKTALMAAIALTGFTMLEESAAQADQADDPRAALVAQGAAYIAFARRHVALFRLMFADSAGMTLPEQQCRGAYDAMARRVAQLAPDRAEAGTLACWGLVHGLATLALDGRLAPDPLGEAAAIEIMVGALGAEGL